MIVVPGVEQDNRLNEALVAFLESGISISVAACDRDRRATVSRAVSCRVSMDRRRLTVVLAASACAPLLRAIAATGAVAVVFSEPTTHRSVQLKGTGAEIGPVAADLLPLLSDHVAAFTHELAQIGFSAEFTRTLMSYDPAELVAVSFSPTGAFTQTPGPDAGEPLKT